ncbi:MAG: protein-L-isoaspartate(D-aspartate) O-methyltransferase [Planctomycetota bacterium]
MTLASIYASCCLATGTSTDEYQVLRDRMVAEEIESAGVKDRRVLEAMRATPRHEFVPAGFRQYAYLDAALPIGQRQTISPPFVVAYMTEQLDPKPDDRVLEIGTGSGYQAAVLSPLVDHVFTIEIVKPLGRRAGQTLRRLDYDNVSLRIGDGFEGWPEKAPFDKIIVTCSPENVPQPLADQLREGGQMIIPVGERYQQNLIRLTKRNGRLQREALRATLFVPMTGTAEESRDLQPEPGRPQIVNGDFQQLVGRSDQPTGWHYLRNARVVSDPDAAQGKRFLQFVGEQPGKPSRALQGLAIDGRRVGALEFSLQVRGERLRQGLTADQRAAALIAFYDHRRAVIDSQSIGVWSGTFPWRSESQIVAVPLAAREAIVRLGLHGGVGKLEFDDVRMKATTLSDGDLRDAELPLPAYE